MRRTIGLVGAMLLSCTLCGLGPGAMPALAKEAVSGETAGEDARPVEVATELSGVREASNVPRNSAVKDKVKVSHPEGRTLYLEQRVGGRWLKRKSYQLNGGDKAQSVVVAYPAQWKKRTYTSWRLRVPEKTVAETIGEKTRSLPDATGVASGADTEPETTELKTTYGAAVARTRVITVNARPKSIHSRAGVVLDEDGYVIFSKNPDEKRAMASTTKIMTAVLAIEELDADDTVTYNSAAARMRYRNYYGFRVGAKFTRAVALRGMLVPSSNDMATAIACQVAGSNKRFAKMMTAKAREIGMGRTVFKNPHGLPASGHYSTARDMARLMRYAYAKRAFRTAARPGLAYRTRSANGKRSQKVRTTWAPLQKSVKALKAGKTGYTRKAGKCFVGAYQSGKRTYYIATLGSYGGNLLVNCWNDQRGLFKYAKRCR